MAARARKPPCRTAEAVRQGRRRARRRRTRGPMTLFAIPFPAIDPVLVEVGPLAIRWYALAYIVGIFLGWWYAKTLVRNQAIWGPAGSPMKPSDIDDFVVWCAVGIILGGRVGYVLFYDFPRFAENPLEIFAALARRHVVPRRLPRHRAGDGDLRAGPEDPDLVADRRHRALGHLRPVPRPPRQLHQWRALRPRHRRALGHGLSRRRPRAAPPEPALRGAARRHRALHRAPHPHQPPRQAPAAGLRLGRLRRRLRRRRAPSSSSSASPTSRSATSPAA